MHYKTGFHHSEETLGKWVFGERVLFQLTDLCRVGRVLATARPFDEPSHQQNRAVASTRPYPAQIEGTRAHKATPLSGKIERTQ